MGPNYQFMLAKIGALLSRRRPSPRSTIHNDGKETTRRQRRLSVEGAGDVRKFDTLAMLERAAGL